FDPATGTTVLFGGTSVAGCSDNVYDACGDTWSWDGFTWTQRAAGPSAPSARYGASMTYDGATGLLMLFGGVRSNGSESAELWGWDGATWTLASAGGTGSPTSQSFRALAYDPDHSAVVLLGADYGGSCGAQYGYCGETWTWGLP